MRKLSKEQKGFTLVESLLIVLILVVIGGVGYMVYHNNHKTSSTTNTASKTTISSSSNKSTTAPNPYAGWQQLCSSSGGLCMKYPSNWKLSGSDSDGYTITSPSGTIAVAYMPNGTPDRGLYGYENAGNCPSNVMSVTALTTNASSLDIVQAITNCTANVNANATSFTPSSSVIPASEVASQGLKAGHTDNNSLDITLVNSKTSSSTRQLLYISNLSNTTYGTSAAAQQWFNSSDVQTAGKILSSVSYNQ
jgi:Tfp pilus assembly protein PilE